MEKFRSFAQKYGFFIIISLIITVGIFYRIEAYLSNKGLWLDEALLANNFFEHTGYLWVFKNLFHNQIAPGLFLFPVKILTVFFGMSEYVFKFIPFIASIISIFVFYIFSKKNS